MKNIWENEKTSEIKMLHYLTIRPLSCDQNPSKSTIYFRITEEFINFFLSGCAFLRPKFNNVRHKNNVFGPG